jgi:hypothetical protein
VPSRERPVILRRGGRAHAPRRILMRTPKMLWKRSSLHDVVTVLRAS